MVKLIDIIKTRDIIKISPFENLSSALSKLTTSHDAAFVFNKDKFYGVVNPYYDLIRSSYPGNAKVEHCVFHPPRIRQNYSLPKVIQLLIDSKIHYLPVFNDEDGFVGIISARRILSCYRDSPLFKIKIGTLLATKKRPLITVNEDDTLSKALNIFKQTKISKLIVTSFSNKVKGILTYYDIISYLVSPRQSPHQGERRGTKTNFYHLKVKNFAKKYVLTLSPDRLLSEALNLILDKKIGSIVVVNPERRPIGIVTTRDLLRFLVRQEQEKQVQIISKNLSTKSRHILGGFFKYFLNRIKKIPEVAHAKLFVKEEKNGGLYKVVLSLIPKRGKPKIISSEGKNLIHVLKKIKKD